MEVSSTSTLRSARPRNEPELPLRLAAPCSRPALGGGEADSFGTLCPSGCPMSQRLWPAGGRGPAELAKSLACRGGRRKRYRSRLLGLVPHGRPPHLHGPLRPSTSSRTSPARSSCGGSCPPRAHRVRQPGQLLIECGAPLAPRAAAGRVRQPVGSRSVGSSPPAPGALSPRSGSSRRACST